MLAKKRRQASHFIFILTALTKRTARQRSSLHKGAPSSMQRRTPSMSAQEARKQMAHHASSAPKDQIRTPLCKDVHCWVGCLLCDNAVIYISMHCLHVRKQALEAKRAGKSAKKRGDIGIPERRTQVQSMSLGIGGCEALAAATTGPSS